MRSRLARVGVWLQLLVSTTAWGATIPELVTQVSEANLAAHIAALGGPRATPAAWAATTAYIAAELGAYGYTVTTQPIAGSANVIAVKPGLTLPGEVYVLGAHFDTVSSSPGADDNASGVAGVLEVARILAAEPLATTVHFVFFAHEELDYEGSEAYAAALAAASTDVIGMISVDMIGYSCSTPGCQTVLPDIPGCVDSQIVSDVGTWLGFASNTASLHLADAFTADVAAFVPGFETEGFVVEGDGTCAPDTRRSDHKSFWDLGYPAFVVTDGAFSRNPNYHTANDTLETLDMAFAANATRSLLAHVASYNGLGATPAVPVSSPVSLALLVAAIVAVRSATSLRARH